MADLKKKIFIVDDDPILAEMLKDHLVKMTSYEIKIFNTGEECISAMTEQPGIVFLDFYLNSVNREAMDGMEALKEIKKLSPETDVVMLSGQDKIDVAVKTMQYGAFDYIVKGESSFYRAEQVVFNIYRYKKLQGSAAKYKNLTIWFGMALIAVVILVIWLELSGKITNMPSFTY